MHTYSSDRFLSSPPQLRVNSQQSQSIPPGCQKQKITGIFTLRIVTNYLNTMRESLLFRCKLWGMQGHGIILQQGGQNERIINLNTRSTIENITKYFKDMKAICIQILQANIKEKTGSLQKKKVPTDYKQIGWIFVNPQRYIINHILNDFEEVVNIIDLRKQKIGEANVKLSILMYKTQELFIHPTEPIINKLHSLAENQSPIRQPKEESLRRVQPNKQLSNQRQKQIQQDRQAKRYRPSFQEQVQEESLQIEDRRLMKREEQFMPEFKRKSRAEQFLEQYNKNKPKHSELSLIRDKFGFNNPSVEVMKLKYDEVKLLSNVSQDNIKEQPRINLLLKSIKPEIKGKIDYLTISCEQRRQKLKTQTKIILNEPGSNQKIQINYLYMLPNESTDMLIFQIKDGKAEVQVRSLTSNDKIEIKNKNNKRIAIIEYNPISNKVILQNSSKIGKDKPNIQNIKPNSQPKVQNTSKKQKQSAYIYVINWPEHQISMRNKNVGTTLASKLLFDINEPEFDTVEVLLQNSKKQVVYLEVKLAHLFKEQNYFIQGRQVKIISSRGSLSEVLSLIDKLQPEKFEAGPKEDRAQLRQKQNHEQIQKMKQLTYIFQRLSQSQNIQCNELIEALTNNDKISMPKLERLCKMITVQPTSLISILQHYFKASFLQFFTMFGIYHNWNHKYHRSLRKLKRLIINTNKQLYLQDIIKKIKKSKHILFGAINSTTFLSYFIKSDIESERSAVQNLESDFDNQSLGRLLILHFQRYFNNSIKVTELQSFVLQGLCLSNLNIYLLVKMSFEIKKEIESYNGILNQQQLRFTKLFDLERETMGELGISKLLFALDDQITESSVLSNQQEQYRKDTERPQHLRTEREQHVKTERSKELSYHNQEQKKRQHSKQSERVRIDTIQRQPQQDQVQPVNFKTIPIILTDISIPGIPAINSIKFSNQHSILEVNKEEIIFPKAIVLCQDQLYKVQVIGNEKQWEGVFVATKAPQKIKLYQNGQENGRVYLFSQRNKQTQEDQIPFQLITTHQPIVQEQNYNLADIPSNDSSAIFQNIHRAQSPKVKLTIRSIRPTRPLFQFRICSSVDRQAHLLNYPEENEVILQNCDDGWNLRLLGSDLQQITISNYVTSSTYCFTNSADKKVQYLVIIELAQYWNQYPELKNIQTLRIFYHLENLIAIDQIPPGNYDILLQNSNEILTITTLHLDKSTKIARIKASFETQQIGIPLAIKLIDHRTQDLTAQFQFTTKPGTTTLSKSHRYLLSSHPGYRLQLTVFEINHVWEHVKPNRIFSLFNNPIHKQTIESYLKSCGLRDEQEVITWLKSTFELTLGQIDIIFNELFNVRQEKAGWQQFLNLFREFKPVEGEDVSEVMQQFRIFDLKEQGVISEQQMKLIKRILSKNFDSIYKQLESLYYLFVTSHEKENNCIIDLNAPSSQFDYLSFIALISDYQHAHQPKSKPAVQPKQKHQKPSKFLRVKLQSFNKLSINGAPTTLLFKIDGKRLADPVHRCYSHSFSNPQEIVIENKKDALIEIYCQKLNSEGMWEYKMIESAKLQPQINILGGSIKVQIIQSEQRQAKQYKRYAKEDINEPNLQMSPIDKRKQYVIEQDRLQRSGFQRSFWNKSLHQTKQQWSKANATGIGFKQRRKMLELKQQEIRKKMSLFDKFYEE